MTSCWAVMYAVPRGTLKIVAVSVKEDGSCSELQFFWIALGDDYVADRGYLVKGLSLSRILSRSLNVSLFVILLFPAMSKFDGICLFCDPWFVPLDLFNIC